MMSRAAPLLLALLLLPAAAGSAAAQEPSAPGAAAPPTAPQPRRARSYTGLDIRHSGSMDANRVVTQTYPVVGAVAPDSPGQQAGIAAGDVIIEVDGADSRTQGALWLQPGIRYTLRLRNGEEEREVVLVPLPPRTPPAPPAP